MSRLRVKLLGETQVTFLGNSVKFDRSAQKSKWFIGYIFEKLFILNQPVSKAELITQFSLSVKETGQIISDIRRDEWPTSTCLAYEDEVIQLQTDSPTDIYLDTAEFHRLLEENTYTSFARAELLYRGEFMQDLLDDEQLPALVRAQKRFYSHKVAEIREKLFHYYEKQHQNDQAIAVAIRMIEDNHNGINPYISLLTLYWRTGDKPALREFYRHYESVLRQCEQDGFITKDEFSAVQKLFNQIQSGHFEDKRPPPLQNVIRFQMINEKRPFDLAHLPLYESQQKILYKTLHYLEHSQNQKAVLLTGINGAGKTTIAMHVANQWLEHGISNQVLWLNTTIHSPEHAKNADNLNILGLVSDALGIVDPPDINDFRELLEENDITLVVVDGYVDAEMARELRQWLNKNTALLLISNITFAMIPAIEVIPVKGLMSPEAVQLFDRFTQHRFPQADVLRIVDKLDHLPLAIDIAAQNMSSRYLTIDQLIEAYEYNFDRMPGYKQSHPSLAALFQLTYRQLSTESQSALKYMGILVTTFTTIDFLSHVMHQDKTTLQISLDKLKDASFVVGYDSLILMPSIIHQFARRLYRQADLENAIKGCLRFVERCYQDKEVQAVEPDIENILGLAEEAYQLGSYDLLLSLMYTLAVDLNYSPGESISKRFISQLENITSTWQAMSPSASDDDYYKYYRLFGKLGNQYESQGKYGKAIASFQMAMDIGKVQFEYHESDIWYLNYAIPMTIIARVLTKASRDKNDIDQEVWSYLDEARGIAIDLIKTYQKQTYQSKYVFSNPYDLLARVHENEAYAFIQRKSYEEALICTEHVQALAQAAPPEINLGERCRFALLNAGAALQCLARDQKRSFEESIRAYHHLWQEADGINSNMWRARANHGLGDAFWESGDNHNGLIHLRAAILYYRKIGMINKVRKIEDQFFARSYTNE